MTEHSNIVVAIDAELNVLERRVSKLKELRRQALEIDGAPPPKVATESKPATEPRAPRRTAKKHSPPLVRADVVDTARDLLERGPVTVAEIFRALGRSPTTRSREVIEATLDDLGALVVGKSGRGGAVAYALRSPRSPSSEALTPTAPAPSASGGYFRDGLYVPASAETLTR